DGDLLEARVAGQVAVLVVVPLEMIYVDHGDTDRGRGGQSVPPGGFQCLVEAAPVGQAGERVGQAERLQLCIGHLQLPGPLRDLVLQVSVEQRVVQGDGKLTGDEPDGVEPYGGERAAAPRAVQP